MLKLYWHPFSGHAHRAHMLLSMLELDFELITVDLPAGEHQQAEFLALNPFGQIPVLVDGETVIADLALYSYIKLAPEGGISLADFPDVQVWLKRVEALPHFVPVQLSNVGLRKEAPSSGANENND
ncbi:hypothetical protein BOO30_08690 [Vibrio navarrensis]|uniref:glutathione S-transferase N-terminal domain-containing protein n=1 Tax=Vibrio navarrensis TaxID=29495 RepID=UPI0018683B31|nr:glutathione S-transferase N-terminal domain-containing protein [Vibrio navarrensis]EJK2113978.1 glutathione S-transferase N-terminal domain-containing protein [Vibrio navarrensis]MBE3664336.1 hypothetical protein [Vibrio navarrensis]MBE4577562.1 hypothetical protein [Vibrio navarrensis]MBE4587368.1 hypothetical protein [Vibrio navarrensis]MBE4596472.1 hypothetical protein [Vibrio navarrensis]